MEGGTISGITVTPCHISIESGGNTIRMECPDGDGVTPSITRNGKWVGLAYFLRQCRRHAGADIRDSLIRELSHMLTTSSNRFLEETEFGRYFHGQGLFRMPLRERVRFMQRFTSDMLGGGYRVVLGHVMGLGNSSVFLCEMDSMSMRVPMEVHPGGHVSFIIQSGSTITDRERRMLSEFAGTYELVATRLLRRGGMDWEGFLSAFHGMLSVYGERARREILFQHPLYGGLFAGEREKLYQKLNRDSQLRYLAAHFISLTGATVGSAQDLAADSMESSMLREFPITVLSFSIKGGRMETYLTQGPVMVFLSLPHLDGNVRSGDQLQRKLKRESATLIRGGDQHRLVNGVGRNYLHMGN